MLERPTRYRILRARDEGICPWCGESTEGLENEFCRSCHHSTRRPVGPADPGTRSGARLFTFVALLLIVAVAVMQQLGTSVIAQPTAAHKPEAIQPPSAQVEITSKVLVKLSHAFAAGTASRPSDSGIRMLDDQARSPEDKFRAAIVSAELVSVDEARGRLDTLEPTLAAESPIVKDIRTLREIYNKGAPDTTILVKHHGWVGKLAASYGTPDESPARAALIGGGKLLISLFFIGGGIVFTAVVTGFVLLLIGIVKAANGSLRMRLVPPSPGGSVAIETVALFAFGFLILKLIILAIEPIVGTDAAVWITLAAQWLLIGVVWWPRYRGAREGSALLGWYRGEGILKEVGCGIIGYLACLPILITGAIVSVVLMLIYSAIRAALGHAHEPPPDNTILELAGRASLPELAMIFVLATVWAPIVEESVFRGGMYRHLRSSWPWFPAAALSAVCFGVMHGYPILLLGPVIALGTGFALLREWRGSLIASATAHCMHNATVLSVLIILTRTIMA